MKKWLIVVLGTSLASVCLAQTKVPSTKQAPKAPALVKFSMDMLAGERIDLAYKAIPAAKVVDAIEKIPNKMKGEYESSADYNARMDAVLNARLVGDASLAEPFAFALPVTDTKLDRNGVTYLFDADTGEASLFVLPKILSANNLGRPESAYRPFELKNFDQFDLGTASESSSLYKGRNAFGTAVTVAKLRSTAVGIAANPVSFLKFKREYFYSKPEAVAKFSLDNAKAPKELPALKALVIMKLAPYLVYNQETSAPTVSSPVDEVVQGKYLAGDILGIVYYSGKTGEILARVPEHFGIPAPAPVIAADAK